MKENNIYEQIVADSTDTVNVTLPIGVNVDVKVSLTIAEKEAFVDRIAGAVFDEDGDYHPEYIEPIFEITLLQMTTDIPVFEDDAEENVDIEKTYELCKALDLYHGVKDSRFSLLVNGLREMVYDKVDFIKTRILAGERQRLEFIRNEMEDGIALINSIAENLMESMQNMSDIDGFAEEFSRLNDSFEKMSEDEIVNSILEANQKE